MQDPSCCRSTRADAIRLPIELWDMSRLFKRSNPVLAECMKFHEASSLAEYVLDELVSHGFTDLESVMHTFCRITADFSDIEIDASFSYAYDQLLDPVIDECKNLYASRVNSPTPILFSAKEELIRQLLMETVASRRLSVKLEKLSESAQVALERDPINRNQMAADELLEIYTKVVPTVPLLRENAILLRSFLVRSGNRSALFGPTGYALTSVMAVLGVTV
jgi:hypothetical protein